MLLVSDAVPACSSPVTGSTTTMLGLTSLDDLVDLDQMHFQAKRRRPDGMKVQQALLNPAPQVDSDGPHVANDLVRGFFKREEDASLSARAGGVDKMSGQACFPRARRSGHQNAAAPKVALAAEHRVQRGNARRHPLVGRHMIQIHRGHRQHGNAVVLNQEGILVHPVRGAAVLDHAQTPRQTPFRSPGDRAG